MRKIYILICLCCFSGILSNKLSAQVTTMPTGNPASAVASQCGGTFMDNGGAGNYTNTQNEFLTICPSIPGQYLTITFTSFSTQANVDYLVVFDGNSSADAIVGIYSGAALPPAITSTSGCLSFRFFSNGITVSSGWSAVVTCSPAPGPIPAASPQDCGGGQGITICSDATFGGLSSGLGVIDELDYAGASSDPVWNGCLNSGESQSSWYYFRPSASGTLEFTITPTNGTDDYDWAIWGPDGTALPCPAYTGNAPIRCSYASNVAGGFCTPGGNTGLLAGNTDNSEAATPCGAAPAGINGFCTPLGILVGQYYVMCIDNFSASFSPFVIDINLSGGAALDCTPLPIVLEQFDGKPKENFNLLYWSTSTEVNNSYFTIEKSEDGINWTELSRQTGAGNSNVQHNYSMVDPVPFKTTYYRLSQTDYNGHRMDFKVITIDRNDNGSFTGDVFGFYPNPANDFINVQTFGDGENLLTIRDQAGKSIFNATINGKTIQTINLGSTLSSGLYFITIENQGKTQNEKIIIAK